MSRTSLLGLAVVWALVVMGGWFLPVTPMALWRAELALQLGRPHAAVAAYDQVAGAHPSSAMRIRALERAALLLAVDLARPSDALLRYERLLQEPMPARDRARTLASLGDSLGRSGRFDAAAQRLREAHDLAPDDPEASARLVRSAGVAARAGDLALAEKTWKRLAGLHPTLAGRAMVERAHLRLREQDTVGGLALYEAAREAAFDPAVVATAELGVATCLERLGDAEQALEQLARTDLEEVIKARREASIRQRQELSEQP